jgi:predicted ATPase
MRIEQIRLKNFKMFQDVTVKGIEPFTVLVGANGSGKSTFFDVFGFLRDCLKDNVRAALAKRGGFREVITRGREAEELQVELKIRMGLQVGSRLVTYRIEISQSSEKVRVKRELLQYSRKKGGGQPFRFIDFRDGAGSAINNEAELAKGGEEKREDQELDSPDILAIKGLGQFQRFEAASAIRNLIENWHVSDFHISAARATPEAGVAEHLSTEGENLPLVAQFLYETNQDVFDEILAIMRRRVPGVADVQAKQTEDGRIVLRFKDGSFKDPFVSRFVSDGTIKMFAYLVLLHDPKPHPLLCVEEPENQLYPSLMGELAEEFEAYARRGGQVFVSTHSPDFLNSVPLKSLFVLTKSNGLTSIRSAADFEPIPNLIEAGDKLGWLWRQGMFKGVNPQ